MSNVVETRKNSTKNRKVEYKTLDNLKTFVSNLDVGVSPTVHVNGHQFTTAIAVVDFGSPLEQVKLSQEQTDELNDKLRELAREIYDNRPGSIRINHDGPNGVFYANVA